MNETDDEKCSLNKKEQLLIEGYKALNQYGCQMSQDHLSVDRIFMPLSLAPAYYVLTQPNGEIDSKAVESLILFGGVVFIVFWMLRNWRSKKRLYAIWDILPSIERQLKFAAHRTLRKCMNKRPSSRFWLLRRLPPRDFTLKSLFGWLTLAFYGAILLYVWCPSVVSWFCC